MEYLLSLMLFTFVASISPGPNNIMLLTSGVNFGVKRSLPHYFGICIGFVVLVATVGLGLGTLFTTSPYLHQILKIAGALYLAYFAWRIGNSGSVSSDKTKKPITFFQAALFQWINPKAWVIAIGAIATFTIQSNVVASITAIVMMYFIMGSLAMGAWLLFGAKLQRFLSKPRRRHFFNIAMAGLLVLSIIPMLIAPNSL